MAALIDSFWRALGYCLHLRVLGWAVLPLLSTGLLAASMGYLYWEGALDAVSAALEGGGLTASALGWLDGWGAQDLRMALVPLIVVMLSAPLLAIGCLLVVSWLLLPRLANRVAAQRFPSLQRRGEASFIASATTSLAATGVAAVMLVATMPLWLLPPLVVVLPPLVCGWLSFRVMSLGVLSLHASADERSTIVRTHRPQLLTIGIATAWLGAAPALLWAGSPVLLVLAPLWVVASVWVYTLAFAFAALWFSHFALAALAALRAGEAAGRAAPLPVADLRALGSPAKPSV